MGETGFSFPSELQGFSFAEYLIIFVGLIFALAVAEFFLSVGQLIREWKRTRFYWEFYLWIFILLDFFILTWYVSWVRLENITDGLYMFFLFTFPNLVIFLLTSIYFPSFKGGEKIDLKVHFLEVRPKLFWLFSVYSLFNIVLDSLLDSEIVSVGTVLSSVYFILGVSNALVDRKWLRIILVTFLGIHLTALMILLRW